MISCGEIASSILQWGDTSVQIYAFSVKVFWTILKQQGGKYLWFTSITTFAVLLQVQLTVAATTMF